MHIRLKWVLRVGILSAVALAVLFGVRLKWTPAPAITSSIVLSATAAGPVFETDVIETDATLAGMSWSGRAPSAVWVRASQDAETWTDWIPLAIDPLDGPDDGSAEGLGTRPATDPVYFGPISFLQYRVEDSTAEFTASAVRRFSAEVVETSGRGLSVRDKIVRFVSSVEFGTGSDAQGVPGTPNIIPAEAWGGPQCLAGTQPRKLPRVRKVELVVVHHAGNNSFSPGQGARDLIYSFCAYHVSTRGWWDIAYNFLIDREGNIYEGRRGSIEEQIQGGHARGFNSYSVGVAMMGNFEEAAPTQAAVDGLEEFLAWRMNMHAIPASGVVTVTSQGSNKWPEGTDVQLYRISGHRDTGLTADPGKYFYPQLPAVRAAVAAGGQPKFSLDFSDFNQIVPGTTGNLLVQAPAGANWTISAIRRMGSTVWAVSGTGPRTVSWDGAVEPGPYTIRADFGALGVFDQVIQVGNYEWPFVDDEGSYAVSELEDMWKRGITLGCDWNRYCPSDSLTRGELAALVARAMDGESSYPSYQGDYSDVAAGQFYTGPVEYLVDEGVLPGGGGPLGVELLASRALVVDMILSALGDTNYPAYQGYFSDVPEGAWFTPKIERAYDLGIALGFPDGTFGPSDSLTREEAAAFLMRGLE